MAHQNSNKKQEQTSSEEIRLNKYIANAGVCSRREADNLISEGKVSVNGTIVTDMGTKVTVKDEIKVNNKQISTEKKVYILLNKPKDYITSLSDPHERRTVYQLIKNACEERVYPVGRLDRNTTGVLLLTNDGELTQKLTHPSNQKKKIYHVKLDRNVTKSDMERIVSGIELEEIGFVQADAVSYVEDQIKDEVGIEIHSGQNRIIRRIFEHLDYEIIKLDRVSFAGLTKKNLPRGKWRLLTPKEISFLKMSKSKKK